MKKHSSIDNVIKDNNLKKFYILTRPSKLSDLTFDDLENDEQDLNWQERSRRLQIRRWRKIRHQLA